MHDVAAAHRRQSRRIAPTVVPGRAYIFGDPSRCTVSESRARLSCRVTEWKPPFAAPAVAVEVVGVLQEYNLTTVTGDVFSGQTWPSVLKDAGLASYVVADKSKGDIFYDFLPLLNGQLVELLDRKRGIMQERAISQLLALERTVSKQGKDSIGHPRGGVDDVINAVAARVSWPGKRRAKEARSSRCRRDRRSHQGR